MSSFPYQQIGSLSGFATFLTITYLVVWTLTLIAVLRNESLTEISRFMWVFIVVMAPLIGIILYLVMAPSPSSINVSSIAESEAKARTRGVYEKTKWENR